uniref:Uncharacterized protein n=1 Tax=Neolamprologus brichardi TaxID=32507 RepID=A0A3Q4GR90_NEOBR
AQRSQEDAEEIERERRRRAREKQRGERMINFLCSILRSDEELKPSCSVGLDEDEGFSDWSHRLETRNEQEMQNGCRAKEQRPSASPPNPQSDQHQVDEEGQEEKISIPQITERAESLRRSTSNIKKTLPPLPVSKIDKRLEQYTHALEVKLQSATTTLKIYKTKSLIYDFNACCPIPYVFIWSAWVAQKSTFTRVSG